MSMFRFWILVILSFVLVLALFVLNTAAFVNYSSYSNSIELIGPNDAISIFSEICLTLYMVLIALLCVDIRARDAQNHMVEVLDSRPYSNIALVIGRSLGNLFVIWLALTLSVTLVSLIGSILDLAGSPFGGSLGLRAIFIFSVYMAAPALTFCGGFTVLAAILLRNRFLALAATLCLVFVLFSLAESKPYALGLALDLIGNSHLTLSSKWGEGLSSDHWWIQRVGVLLFGFGFLALAVAFHPRLDSGSKIARSALGLLSVAGGGVLMFLTVALQHASFSKMDDWNEQLAKLPERAVDIVSVDAMLTLEPAEKLDVDATIEVANNADKSVDALQMLLNPGLAIRELRVGGAPVEYSFDSGVVSVRLGAPILPSETIKLSLLYSGAPDTDFAYFNTANCLCDRNAQDGLKQLLNLGTDVGIFDDRYIALMPGLRWLPEFAARPIAGKAAQSMDRFELSLKVSAPNEWSVVGPGKNLNDIGEGFLFQPTAEVSEVAIISAQFLRSTQLVNGVEFNLFIHPEHDGLLSALAPAKNEISDWIDDQLSLIKEAGLHYPLDAFSVVEVPNRLRIYGGGWEMNSVLSPSGMALVRENGLPSAHFNNDSENVFSDLLGWQLSTAGGKTEGEALRARLLSYIRRDFVGSNILSSFAKSIFANRVEVIGEGSLIIQAAVNELADLSVSGQRNYFVLDNALVMDNAVTQLEQSGAAEEKVLVDRVINLFSHQPAVWESMLGTKPLDEIGKTNARLASDASVLEGGLLAKLIYDLLGPRGSGEFLAEILENALDGKMSTADIVAHLEKRNTDLAKTMNASRRGNNSAPVALMGVKVLSAEAFKLPHAVNGRPAYQYILTLRNPESAAGFVRVQWRVDSEEPLLSSSEPIFLSGRTAVEFGLVLSQPPEELWVQPYLSLNRRKFRVEKPRLSDLPAEDYQEFTGVKVTAFKANEESGRIVIDDLDDGFEAIQPAKKGIFSSINPSRTFDPELFDEGLPTSAELARFWTRSYVDNAWGNYRHTAVLSLPGDGSGEALFTTKLPNSGRWKLSLHLPEINEVPLAELGRWNLSIRHYDNVENIVFDAGTAKRGWNELFIYSGAAGEVVVSLTNQTMGKAIVADAIAWDPL